MTVAATDLIALGIGQMRTLMIVNQPILKYYTDQQELVTPPPDYKGNYHLATLQQQLKGIKAVELNSKELDKHLKSDLVFTDVLDKLNNNQELSTGETQYLQTQKAALDVVGSILTGPVADNIKELTNVLSTVSGLDQKFILKIKKRATL